MQEMRVRSSPSDRERRLEVFQPGLRLRNLSLEHPGVWHLRVTLPNQPADSRYFQKYGPSREINRATRPVTLRM